MVFIKSAVLSLVIICILAVSSAQKTCEIKESALDVLDRIATTIVSSADESEQNFEETVEKLKERLEPLAGEFQSLVQDGDDINCLLDKIKELAREKVIRPRSKLVEGAKTIASRVLQETVDHLIDNIPKILDKILPW